MAKFIESSKIKVFPAGFRKGALDTSKLTTEENLTSLTILSSDNTIGNRWITNPLNNKETIIYIKGYRFVFATADIPEKYTWAAIQLRELGVGNNNKTNVLKPVESTDAKATNLDDNGGNFIGLGFYENEPSGDDIYKVKKDSSLVLNSSEIKDGASNANIAEQFTTKKITVGSIIINENNSANISGVNTVNGLALDGGHEKISIKAISGDISSLTVTDGVNVNIASDETTLGNIKLTKEGADIKINDFNLPNSTSANTLLAFNGTTNSWIKYSNTAEANTIVKRSGNDIKAGTLNGVKIWLDKLETQEEPILKLTHEFTNATGKSARSGLGIEWPATLTVSGDGSIQTDTDNDSVTGNVISIGAGTLIKQDKNKKFVQIGNTENTVEKVITLPLEGTTGGVLYDKGNNTAEWRLTTTNGHPLESANENARKIVMTTDTGLIEGLAPTKHSAYDKTVAETYGLAAGDIYGHVRLQAGDLSNKDYENGVAASVDHNHDGKYAERWDAPFNFEGGYYNFNNNDIIDHPLNWGDSFNIPSFSVNNKGLLCKTTVDSEQPHAQRITLPNAYNMVGVKRAQDTKLYLTGAIADNFTQGDVALNYNVRVYIDTDNNLYAPQLYLTSDKRLKENERPYKSDKSILDLPIYKYDYINGSKNQIGCMAQDLKEICPEIVEEDEKGYLHIQESKIVYLLIEEIKKLKEEIKNLKK